jgi:hypothetical protein
MSALSTNPPSTPTEVYQAAWTAMTWLDENDRATLVAAEREVEAKAQLDHEKDLLESSEAYITDEQMARDDLKNEAQRKAAINKALAASPEYVQQQKAVREATVRLRKAELVHQGAKDSRKSGESKLNALGHIAKLMAEHTHLAAVRIQFAPATKQNERTF